MFSFSLPVTVWSLTIYKSFKMMFLHNRRSAVSACRPDSRQIPWGLELPSRFAPGAPQLRSPAGSLCADLWSAGRPGSNPGTVLIKTEEWKVEDTGRAIFFTSLSNLDQLRLCSFKPAPSLPHLTGCTQQPRIPKPHEHLLLHQREVGRCKRLSLLCLKISEAGAFP